MKILGSLVMLAATIFLSSCAKVSEPLAESSINITQPEISVIEVEKTADTTSIETIQSVDTVDSLEIPEITREALTESRRFLTVIGAYTQSICVSDNYVYISHSTSMDLNKNDYVLRKYDRFTGNFIAEGTWRFNHANGMTYNSKTDEIIITALDGNGTATTSIGIQDYCLFVADPETLKFKRLINLRDIILDIEPSSVGISAVAFNEITEQYYVLTRHPERRIVILTKDFSYVSDFPTIARQDPYLHGDICCDGEYIYTTAWVKPSLKNVVDIYTLDGEFIDTKEVNGLTHIEGIDRRNGRFYVCFIDFNVSPYSAVVCEMDELGNVN